MFPDFPKKRMTLPAQYREIYLENLKANRGGKTPASSMAQRMEAWMHRQVARTAGPNKVTLEIGAGTLNQLDHEINSGPYDIVEPEAGLYNDSVHLSRIRHTYSDIAQVPGREIYDRITSVAVLEHICDLPAVIARSVQLIKPDGTLAVGIPSEGTPLWTLGWKLTTGLEFKLKRGLDYGVLMAYEHVNQAHEIEAVLRHFFGDIKAKVFGIHRYISLYQYFECGLPQVEKAAEYLAQINS